MGTKLKSKEKLKEEFLKGSTKEKPESNALIVLPHESKEKEIIQMMDLNTKDLISSQAYQRNLDQKRISYIVSNFDPHKFGVIKVSFRDGKYYVYDGQHRIAALKVLHNNMDDVVKCEVHNGLTYEDEAKYFAEQYLGSKNISIVYRWRALYEAKEEPVYSIVDSVRALGIDVKFTKAKAENRIIAFKQLNDMWTKLGADKTLKILTLLKKAWGTDENAFDGNIILGMREFFNVYMNEINEETFVRQMKKVTPSQLVVEGKKDNISKKGLNFAKVIWIKYNNGLRTRRLDYKFKG